MSNGSKVLIFFSFLLKDAVFQLLLQLQTNIWLLCIFIYENKKLSFSHYILFYNSKNRHLEFLNLSPQGLISSKYIFHKVYFRTKIEQWTAPNRKFVNVILLKAIILLIAQSNVSTIFLKLKMNQVIQGKDSYRDGRNSPH